MKITLHKQLIPNIGTVVAVAFLLFAYTAWAAPSAQTSIPGVITYQGTLTDDAGQPINTSVNLTFRLYSVSSGGTALWAETHSGVVVEDGLFRVGLGSQTPIPATVWDNIPLYLGIQVGSEPEMSPREELGAVPFAMYANQTETAQTAVTGVRGFQVGDDTNFTRLDQGAMTLQDDRDAWDQAGEIIFIDNSNSYRWGIIQDSNHLFFKFDTPDINWPDKMRLYNNGNLWVEGSISNGAIVENNLQTPGEKISMSITRFSEGDLLCWGAQTEKLEKCAAEASGLVVAVADPNGKPIVLGAEPVKVLGPVVPGDLLVASDVPGYAVAWSQIGEGTPPVGVVIAKALETFEGEQGSIKAMILGR